MITEVVPPAIIYRLAREPDPWTPPDWAYSGKDGTFGNRFDDPRGTYRVLYASSSRLGCFLETLARFRVDIELRAALAAISGPDDHVPLGVVPREWRDGRMIGAASASGVFAEIGSAESLATLRDALAETALALGLGDLDAAAIRISYPRAFTQEVSRHVYDSGRFDGALIARGMATTLRIGPCSSRSQRCTRSRRLSPLTASTPTLSQRPRSTD